ncbi:hypothetical protein Achl_4019 (plasmid) [Pseudarthrobacter chlorophenolicus A6]|uniref:Uncharacterized protein n=1 Tax=Pseudarthrobacter chlorophenolicus (strain ATCC 700700 / DSM 12829 / CIP 107037 / JCM 12360 / KCTC 9906 / NCIMB 13794 / A6) TaxID=452863 RepID=B8HHS3_PSECP|nr:hypothetical protein [Pseudarthrobacter chlorophenolicus]ACL41970.1 hypothetical protein Achl_4019 [Pseudarthrobacter chlorophenolicus A6]SDQ19646.1 hypothetical protein SAMN04489738_0670 [Pseudarthrobacter chlorophenolicus]
MIRNNSEYMLADGSPRYGIRTTGLAQVSVATAPSLIRVGQTADAAALLDAAELKLAVQHRFVLDKYNHADADIISGLRADHPEELEEAEAIVAKRLGSPVVWMRGAKTAYTEAVIEEAQMDGTLMRQLAASLMSIGLTVAMMVIVIGLAAMKAPPLISLVIVTGIYLGTRPIQRKLGRTVDPGNLPTRIDREDARLLWDDVVNATLVAILQSKDVPIDQGTVKAALRGWNHTRYVGTVAQDLRTNPAQP